MTLIMKAVILILAVGGLWMNISAQSKVSNRHRAVAKLNRKHPSIYLSLEKIDTVVDSVEDEQERVWLRLHNNSKFTITLDASGGNKYEDATMFFVMMDSHECVKDRYLCHVCSRIDLKSGQSILFTVPLYYFNDLAALRLEYSYQWEKFNSNELEQEPTHYVFFYTSNLNRK